MKIKKLYITIEEKPTGEISAGAGVGTWWYNFGFGVKENNYLVKVLNLNTLI